MRALITAATAVLTCLALAAPAQASRVSDPRDRPAGKADVREVGVWRDASRLTLVVKLHEPVPEFYSTVLDFEHGRDHFQAAVGWDTNYAELTLDDDARVYEVDFRNHRTFVWKITDARIRGRSWRYATNVRLTDGSGVVVDRVRNVRP